MTWKVYDFECGHCGEIFEELVDEMPCTPDECPKCHASGEFRRLPSGPAVPTTIVPDYPGAKRRKAGYVHTHGNRPAEKKGSQVSMFGSDKSK